MSTTSHSLATVSVILPCLNEAKAIAMCIDHAQAFLQYLKIHGEIIVVDNDSSDGSYEIAKSKSVIVVREPERGYGSAIRRGISLATGTYIVLLDADGTYNIFDAIAGIDLLHRGYDLVVGSRLLGSIEAGAMPWMHRYLGVPLLTWFTWLLTKYKITDSQSGLRIFKASTFKKMDFHSAGMEFATEMILIAASSGLKFAEYPVSYSKRLGISKLNAINDALRHLILILSWLFSSKSRHEQFQDQK